MDVVKENMEKVCVTEEDARDWVKWRQTICCDDGGGRGIIAVSESRTTLQIGTGQILCLYALHTYIMRE